MRHAATSAVILLATLALLMLTGCPGIDRPDEFESFTEDDIIGVWSLTWMATDSNRVDETYRVLPGSFGWSIRRNGDSLRVKYFSMGELQYVRNAYYDGDSLWLAYPEYADNRHSPIHLVPDGEFLRTTYDGHYYENAEYYPDRLHVLYESMPLDHAFEYPMSDALAEQILAKWDFALYDSLCFELAQLEPADIFDPVGGFTGTRNDWTQLSAYMKSSYVWNGSFDIFDAGDDRHLAYAALCRPEAAGIGWTDWAEGRSLDEIIAILEDNDWQWPGGSEDFVAILEDLHVWWRYPGRE